MREERLIIEVFDGLGNPIDTFDMPVDEKPFYATLPEAEPYRGLQFYIKPFLSDSGERIYEFSPDGYEYWVRFSQKTKGRTEEYLLDKKYVFLFHTYIKE